jgi:hypothetical protein
MEAGVPSKRAMAGTAFAVERSVSGGSRVFICCEEVKGRL